MLYSQVRRLSSGIRLVALLCILVELGLHVYRTWYTFIIVFTGSTLVQNHITYA